MDHGANLSVYFEDPDGHMLEVTYEKPRETWPPGRNPFAGASPCLSRPSPLRTRESLTPMEPVLAPARPLRGGSPGGGHP